MAMDGTYTNGQIKSKLESGIKTVFFKDGTIKAQGGWTDSGKMNGKWTFYKQKEPHIWQIGYFKNNSREGKWTRFDPKTGKIQREMIFKDDMQI